MAVLLGTEGEEQGTDCLPAGGTAPGVNVPREHHVTLYLEVISHLQEELQRTILHRFNNFDCLPYIVIP